MTEAKEFIEKLDLARFKCVDEALSLARNDGYDGGRKQFISALLTATKEALELNDSDLALVSGGNMNVMGCPCSSPCSNRQKCWW